ncbi:MULTISPECIES: ABC-three component system middle component 6 [Acinetobacter]|jgi:hypothetical protein|uniref:ABC-three component system middle component 6 n=2 Tax=Acinetobacter TaxID=469 RepID=UPI00339D6F89|nr:hypothetical protein [Acinetobacter baumannii]
MILLSNKNPKNSVYYLGSVLLKIMIQNKENNLGINDYYDLVNSIEPISMNRFLLVLDWLYMLGKINSDSKKGLILCI